MRYEKSNWRHRKSAAAAALRCTSRPPGGAAADRSGWCVRPFIWVNLNQSEGRKSVLVALHLPWANAEPLGEPHLRCEATAELVTALGEGERDLHLLLSSQRRVTRIGEQLVWLLDGGSGAMTLSTALPLSDDLFRRDCRLVAVLAVVIWWGDRAHPLRSPRQNSGASRKRTAFCC